jgi:hypothetical protein
MESEPMVASRVCEIKQTKHRNDWELVRPGREEPEFKGSKKQALEKARKLLHADGGGIIRVSDFFGNVREERRVSSGGSVLEQRVYRPLLGQLDKGSEAPETAIVSLRAPVEEGGACRHLYLVLGLKDNEVLAVVDIDGDGSEALERAGFDFRPPIMSLKVSEVQLDSCWCEWGSISAVGVERRAAELCEEEGPSLDGFADDPRFQLCPEALRRLAAAVWTLWDRRLASHEIQTPAARVVRVSRFLLWIDQRGCVSIEVCPSVEAAVSTMQKLAAEQSPQMVDSLVERVFDPSAPRCA